MLPNLEKTCSAFSARAVSANAVIDCPRIPAASSARLLTDELTRQFKRVYELSSCRNVAIYVAVCHMRVEQPFRRQRRLLSRRVLLWRENMPARQRALPAESPLHAPQK